MNENNFKNVKFYDYQPNKAELNEEIRINSTPEEWVGMPFGQVTSHYKINIIEKLHEK